MKAFAISTLVIVGGFFLPACSKSDKPNPTPQVTPPTVASINPTQGPKSTPVTITGNNFGTDMSKVTVTFNGMAGTVQSVSNTSIVALVPAKANTGKVSVTVNGLSADGPIFTYTASYAVATLAGNGSLGKTDGSGATATFGFPTGIALDGNGNLFVADQYNNLIRKITLGGTVTVSTFAGGFVSFNSYVDGTGTGAKFGFPTALALDGTGNLIEGDVASPVSLIRKITAGAVVTTLTGVAGGQGAGYLDGALNVARFDGPVAICLDAQGNIYVADNNNLCLRKISTSGIVSTLAGSHSSGYKDGTGTAASFRSLTGLAIDGQGNIYVADPANSCIRKVTPAGVVSTYCGVGAGNGGGYVDGDISVAGFLAPRNLTFDGQGNILVTDVGNNRIRKISTTGAVTTLAGSGSSAGFADGDGASALFNYPNGICVDSQGNIYVADGNNYRIRIITQQ